MVSFTAICFLIIFYVIRFVNGSCAWDVPNYGHVDFSLLASLQIDVIREEKTQYSLSYTPCQNNLICNNWDSLNGMALQVNTGSLPDINCNAIISIWDNGHVAPKHEKSINNEDQITFYYPTADPKPGGGDSCEGGRTGQFTFICNQTAVPWIPVEFRQDQKDENGICAYYATIATIYACSTGDAMLNSSDMSGGSIFLFAFVGVIIIYCIIGYGINAKRGKQWKDYKSNVPNYSFWIFIPKLVKVGCIVTKEYLYGVMGKKAYDGDTDNLMDVELADN